METYLKSAHIANYLNDLDNDTAIACPIGRMQYVVDFDKVNEIRDEITKMEKYIEELKTEREQYFRRSINDKKKKIEIGKEGFQNNLERCGIVDAEKSGSAIIYKRLQFVV